MFSSHYRTVIISYELLFRNAKCLKSNTRSAVQAEHKLQFRVLCHRGNGPVAVLVRKEME